MPIASRVRLVRLIVVMATLMVAAMLVFARPLTIGVDEAAAATIGSSTSQPRQARDPHMNAAKAVVLGVVEGLTEFIPVSSTGHLMVAQRAMDIGQHAADKTAADTYAVVIQIGAILAVVLLYRERIGVMLAGLFGRNEQGRHLLVALIVATLPAIVLGVAFNGLIKEHLFGSWPVVAAWLVGGIAILVFNRNPRFGPGHGGLTIENVTIRAAFLIGLAQCVAMWPGVSRSLVTLLAGLAVGLSLSAAVEFTFLLGLITLSAATVFELAKDGQSVVDAYGVATPVLGVVVSFIAGWAAVKWMIGYLKGHDLAIFGWYRIGIAAIVAALLGTGVL